MHAEHFLKQSWKTVFAEYDDYALSLSNAYEKNEEHKK